MTPNVCVLTPWDVGSISMGRVTPPDHILLPEDARSAAAVARRQGQVTVYPNLTSRWGRTCFCQVRVRGHYVDSCLQGLRLFCKASEHFGVEASRSHGVGPLEISGDPGRIDAYSAIRRVQLYIRSIIGVQFRLALNAGILHPVMNP